MLYTSTQLLQYALYSVDRASICREPRGLNSLLPRNNLGSQYFGPLAYSFLSICSYSVPILSPFTYLITSEIIRTVLCCIGGKQDHLLISGCGVPAP